MRLERLNYNKIKIFLTQDDLFERGLTKEDLWKDSLKVHQLFRDMMNEASEELGFEAHGPIAVEVYSLQAQGMVIIVTKHHDEKEDDEFSDDYLEMEVKVDESHDILFEFNDFEDVIALSKTLNRINIKGGTLYSFENHFYLLLDEWQPVSVDSLICILAEYGNSTPITIHRLHEYGRRLMDGDAIEQICKYFNK
ncbi:genetic competence negative regulator [Bacillus sp. FJAT-47783]|uniref:genetic competence negative regulator n=1 Tax=Bacillus sp. FJAT-47783 TaxID=2922712 RepID=UPI001FAC0C79|nr:genetic competence negative regulator [Bacillus sp. FJAT-47783]